MTRECVYPTCNREISDQLEAHNLSWVRLQPQFQDYREEIGGNDIPEMVALFIFLNPGGCYHEEAAIGLGKSKDYLRRHKHGMVNFQTVKSQSGQTILWVSQQEMARLANLLYCWTSVYQYAKLIHGAVATMLRQASRGQYGETRTNLSGALCLPNSWLRNLEGLLKLYKKTAKANHKSGSPRTEAIEGKMTAQDVADLFDDMTMYGVRRWFKTYKKILKPQKVGRFRVVDPKNLYNFVCVALRENLPLWVSTISMMEKVEAELRARLQTIENGRMPDGVP